MEVAAAAQVKSLLKLAHEAKKLLADEKKCGKFRISGAKNANERQLRDQIQKCVSDMIR